MGLKTRGSRLESFSAHSAIIWALLTDFAPVFSHPYGSTIEWRTPVAERPRRGRGDPNAPTTALGSQFRLRWPSGKPDMFC